MHVSKVTIYTLVALAVSELYHKADTATSLILLSPKVSNFLAANKPAPIQPIHAKSAIASRHSISPPETSEAQVFSLEQPNRLIRSDTLEQSDTVVESASSLSTLPAEVFTPYLEQIKESLPPGWVMRLPSQVLLGNNSNENSSQYQVQVSPSNSESGLTVSLFSCEAKVPSCLVGTFAISATTSVSDRQAFKNHQDAATPVALTNDIRGYLLEGQKQQPASSFSSLMWQQDDQFYTVKFSIRERQNLLNMASSMARSMPIQSLTRSPETASENLAQVEAEESTTSLLNRRHPVLTTADQLQQGEVITSLRYRQSFPSGSARDIGLTGQPTFGITWGVTDNLEITLDAQTVDNSGPVNQGSFNAQRINPDGTGPNFFQELTLQAKQRLWQNQDGTQALSGVVAASLGNAGRPFRFFNSEEGSAFNGQNDEIVTSFELPLTIANDRWQFTLSPKLALFPDDHALYFNTLPVEEPGSFGTTFGIAGGVSYRLNPRLLLWGDAFVPLTGNNTIDRDTGLPDRAVAFNAGVRYWVNPRLATDLFVSNTLGNTGPLSIVTDNDFLSLGLGVTYLPGITAANRRYAQHFGSAQQPPPDTPAGFALLDGGTIPNQRLLVSLQGGGQGLLTGIRYGLLDDLEIGAFFSNIPGTVDESELGFSGKIRFLHQADGDPFTLSGLVTIARSNNVLVNLINDNRNEFEERGLEKGGFAFSNEKDGELFIITLSTPMHYQFKGGSAIWLTPTLGFIQHNGLEVAGLNLGGSVPLGRDLEAIAEAGLEFGGKGNAFIGNDRETVIPWTVGLRWRPASLLGISPDNAFSDLQLEVYATNRLGSTPYGSLRVRADNETAIGFGLVLPIQF